MGGYECVNKGRGVKKRMQSRLSKGGGRLRSDESWAGKRKAKETELRTESQKNMKGFSESR